MTDLNALAERLEEEVYGHGDGDYVTITGKQARQAAQALRGMGEPVAWRWRVEGMLGWNVSLTPDVRIEGAIIEPLFAHPAEPAARDGLTKALADIQFLRKDEPGRDDRYYAERATEIARQALAASGEK